MTMPSAMRRMGASVSRRVALTGACPDFGLLPGRSWLRPVAAPLCRKMDGLPGKIGQQSRYHGRSPGAAELAPGLLVDEAQQIHGPGPNQHRGRYDPYSGAHRPDKECQQSAGLRSAGSGEDGCAMTSDDEGGQSFGQHQPDDNGEGENRAVGNFEAIGQRIIGAREPEGDQDRQRNPMPVSGERSS